MTPVPLTGAGALGAGGVTPPDVAGLQAWYKADAGTSTTTDGVAISQWDDQSGNARHLAQATGAKQPLYKAAIQNGLPVVRFDGTDDWMRVAFALNQPFTVFAVATWRSAFVANEVLTDGGNGVSVLTALFRTAAGTMSLFAGATSNNLTTTPQSFHAYCAEFNGASSGLRADGGVAATGNPGTAAAGGVTVGSDNTAAGAQSADVDVGELIAYNSVLVAADRQGIESYLRSKWATP